MMMDVERSFQNKLGNYYFIHVRKLVFFLAKTKIEEWRGALKAWYVGPRSKKGRFFHFWYRLGFKMQSAPQSAPSDIFLKKWFFHKNVQFSLQCKAPPFWEGRLNRLELQSMDSRLSPELKIRSISLKLKKIDLST